MSLEIMDPKPILVKEDDFKKPPLTELIKIHKEIQ